MPFWDRFFPQAPAPFVFLYTTNGTTIKGSLVACHGDRFEMAACSVAPEGSDNFRPVMGRVVIPRENIDFYTAQ